uniref:ORF1 n=1 Tax=Macaque picobirnavirus 11 TaxID=2078791 RepID=A0A2L1FE71_9VIRU|nr:ORF1 [Macaque picobirnavirus 11]
MTDIQIKFWANQEVMRSNRAQEDLTKRDLSERERHNLISEKISAAMAAASQVQAAAAARQAEIAKELADLQARRVAIEERLESLNAAKIRAETVYTRSKTRSEYYDMLLTQQKTDEARANTSYLESKTRTESFIQPWYESRINQSKSETELNYEKAKTEAILRSQKLVDSISSWASLPATVLGNYGEAAKSTSDGIAGWIMPKSTKGGSYNGYR